MAIVTGEHRVWSRDLPCAVATDGVATAPSEGAQATLDAIVAGWTYAAGALSEVDAAFDRAERWLAGHPDDVRLANQVNYAAAMEACLRLHGDRGAAVAAHGLELTQGATGSAADRNPAGFLIAGGFSHLAAGRLGEAATAFASGTTLAGRSGLPRGIAYFDVGAARLGHLDGQLESTVHVASRAARLGEELGIPLARQLGRSFLALALATLGRVAEAEVALALGLAPTHPQSRFEHDRAQGWVLAARGELGPAATAIEGAAAVAEAAGLRYLEMLARLDLVRLGRGSDQAGRCRALAEGAEGSFAPAVACAAEGMAQRDAPRVLTAVDEFEAMGALLVSAELAALAAELHRAGHHAHHAAAAEARCRRLRERCDPAASPAFARLAGDEHLTDRERELTELAARGWSNADIAATLVLSVRTVENHLQRAYRKLDVRGRSDLPAALGVSPTSPPR